MLSMMDEIRQEVAIFKTEEIAANLYKKTNLSAEEIAECCGISLEDVQRIKEENKI